MPDQQEVKANAPNDAAKQRLFQPQFIAACHQITLSTTLCVGLPRDGRS